MLHVAYKHDNHISSCFKLLDYYFNILIDIAVTLMLTVHPNQTKPYICSNLYEEVL